MFPGSFIRKFLFLLVAIPLAPVWSAETAISVPLSASSGTASPAFIDPYKLEATLSAPANRACCQAVAMTKDLAGIRWAVLGTTEDNDGGRGAAYVYSLLPGTMEWKYETRLSADDGAAGDHFGFSVAIYGDLIAIGAPDRKNAGNQTGSVYMFRHNHATGSWDKEGDTLQAGGGHFGTSVALGSETLAAGAPTLADSGYVTLFDHSAEGWKPSGALTDVGTSGNCFGQSLSLRGNFLAIGGPRCDTTGIGQVYWVVRDGSGWNLAYKYTSENSYGTSVKILDDDGHVAVGAPRAGYAGGVAIEHFYVPWGSSVWTHAWARTVMFNPDPDHGSFGWSLDFANNTLAVGTEGGTGQVYLYRANLGDDAHAAAYQDVLTSALSDTASAALAMDSGVMLAASSKSNVAVWGFDGAAWGLSGYIIPTLWNAQKFGASVSINKTSISHQTGVSSAYTYAYSGDTWGMAFGYWGDSWSTLTYQTNLQPPSLIDVGSFASCQPAEQQSKHFGFLGRPTPENNDVLLLNSPPSPLHGSDEGSNPNSKFGCSLALWEPDNFLQTTLVVGAPTANNGALRASGVAYVFAYDGFGFKQQAKLVASDALSDDGFGMSVAISDSGDRIVIGSPYHKNKGAAYVFERSGSGWIQTKKLVAGDGNTGDEFGASVAVSGGNILIGAPSASGDSGAIYFFSGAATTWNLSMEFKGGLGSAAQFLGSSVAMIGNTAVVGAPGWGFSDIWKKHGAEWINYTRLFGDGSDGKFGISVDIRKDNTVIVGAMNEGDGKAYIFSTDIIFQDGFDPL